MLHAHLMVVQIMDLFEVRAVISEFSPGHEPTIWKSVPRSLILPDGWEEDDALTTTLRLISLWSEVTTER